MKLFLGILITYIVVIIIFDNEWGSGENLFQRDVIDAYKGVIIARHLPRKKIIVLTENGDTLDPGAWSTDLYLNGEVGDTVIVIGDGRKYLLLIKANYQDTTKCLIDRL